MLAMSFPALGPVSKVSPLLTNIDKSGTKFQSVEWITLEFLLGFFPLAR